MEAKNILRSDLENKRFIFREIGLVVEAMQAICL